MEKEVRQILENIEKKFESISEEIEIQLIEMKDKLDDAFKKLDESIKSQEGQGQKQDTIKPTDEKPIDIESVKEKVEKIELRETIIKYRTFYDDGRPRGWLLKLFDENDNETDDGNEWLCRTFVKWIQELPHEISKRDEKNKRDRAYPTKSKRSIYVNDAEMEFIEEIAGQQGTLIQEKEFTR